MHASNFVREALGCGSPRCGGDALEQKGLVDRDVDYRGKALRVYVTDHGAALLEQLYPKIKAASSSAR
jgi:hypothetical protein